MLNPFVSCIIYALEALIYYVFFSRISNPRFCKWKCILIGLCLFEVGSAFNIFFQNTVLVNTTVIILIITVFFKLCFETSIKVALLYSLMLDGLNFAIELIVVFAFSSLLGISTSEYQNDLTILFMETISCKSVFFMVCLMLSNWACYIYDFYHRKSVPQDLHLSRAFRPNSPNCASTRSQARQN